MARRDLWHLFGATALFSLMANLLMLTGPLYMMQLYDRVLFSGSVETLVALTVLMVFLYGMMGVFDFVRGQVMGRAAMRFQLALEDRVFHAALRKAAVLPGQGGREGLPDLHRIQQMINSQFTISVFDLPWVPIFLLMLFAIHPMMGLLAVGGSMVLILLTLGNQLLSARVRQETSAAQWGAGHAVSQFSKDALAVRALGMSHFAARWWRAQQDRAHRGDLAQQRVDGALSVLSKVLRMILASAMLGLGAWLVMGNLMTAGGMFAGSILLSRVLAPIDTILTQWPLAQQGRQGWHRLSDLLGEVPAEPPRTALPPPKAEMDVRGITVVSPVGRRPLLKSLSFAVHPGQAVGVIGPSGAGKSTLARALVGAWPLAGGTIRLDHAALDQYGPEALGRHIGYLPQAVHLFDGSVAQNIARLDPDASEAEIVEAARAAGAHELILTLPEGYDTPMHAADSTLSGGQIQRIGLARALYGGPAILVLDEPNANLDWQGSAALNEAVKKLKAEGGAAVIMTHRSVATKECDMILLLENGQRMAFGPRDEVLGGMVRNANVNRPVPQQALATR